eukprot:scaffold5637_cov121-Isochrysis_galbana.AAC.2
MIGRAPGPGEKVKGGGGKGGKASLPGDKEAKTGLGLGVTDDGDDIARNPTPGCCVAHAALEPSSRNGLAKAGIKWGRRDEKGFRRGGGGRVDRTAQVQDGVCPAESPLESIAFICPKLFLYHRTPEQLSPNHDTTATNRTRSEGSTRSARGQAVSKDKKQGGPDVRWGCALVRSRALSSHLWWSRSSAPYFSRPCSAAQSTAVLSQLPHDGVATPVEDKLVRVVLRQVHPVSDNDGA